MTEDRSNREMARDLRPTIAEEVFPDEEVAEEPPQAGWGEETVFVQRERTSVEAVDDDGKRGAFVTNEEGISRLYLLDTRSSRFSRVCRRRSLRNRTRPTGCRP